MVGSGWCGQVLNVEPANVVSNQSRILGMFSSVHSKGSFVGRGGTGVLLGQSHVTSTFVSNMSLEVGWSTSGFDG